MTVIHTLAELVAALAPLHPEHRESLIASLPARGDDATGARRSRRARGDQEAAR